MGLRFPVKLFVLLGSVSLVSTSVYGESKPISSCLPQSATFPIWFQDVALVGVAG